MSNKKTIIISIISVLLIGVIGFSYAYFTKYLTGDSEDILLTSGALIIELKDKYNLIGNTEMVPGDIIEKDFSVRNSGDLDGTYDLWFADLVNNFTVKTDLTYRIVDTDTDTAVVQETTVPSVSSKVISNKTIAAGVTHNYKLIITYNNVNNRDQRDNLGKTFSFKLRINEGVDVTTPNEPELYAGLVPIKYNNGQIVVANTSQEWYDYENHEWANAVIVKSGTTTTAGTILSTNDILQMYVWIPRYEYKLFNSNAGSSSSEQIINIRFQEETDTKSTGSHDGEWLTHPAFTFGNTELPGFWVGKFETSMVNSSGENIINKTANSLSCTDTNCSNAQYIRILPNNMSLTYNNIKNFFYASRSIEGNSTFGLNSSLVDTHMMKNMEWGAVAYLSQSYYGLYNNNGTCSNNSQTTANGCTVFINNVNVGYGEETNTNGLTFTRGPTVTGCSSSSAIPNHYNTHNETNPTCVSNYAWNENGVLASTTGNIYGIYDMSGGGWEYVMGNQSSSSSSYVYYTNNSGLNAEPASKYFDTYLASSLSTTDDYIQRFDHKRGNLGDATFETMKEYGTDQGTWHSGLSRFVTMNSPWFSRGGCGGFASQAGLLAFGRGNGGSSTYNSFRIVLSSD